ncbi:MAG: hypothetical protein Q7S84_03975 [bacterium]|nr:hypothetical protein [bacterium]
MGAEGFCLSSRRAVALLGLATASRPLVLLGTSSGVRIPNARRAIASLQHPTAKPHYGGASCGR